MQYIVYEAYDAYGRLKTDISLRELVSNVSGRRSLSMKLAKARPVENAHISLGHCNFVLIYSTI